MSIEQPQMPGLASPTRPENGPRGFEPGQEVLYLGRVTGGPRYGSWGVVREVRGRKAVVEIGRRRPDVWHIPCYFLAIPGRAA